MRNSSRWIWKIFLGFALCVAASPWAAEDFSTWEHSAKLRLNTTASGANVAKSIGHFGLLVRITDSRILTQSMATGADVRFADEKGVPLDFQIERWTPAAGKADFWVHMPKVDSLSDKQYLNVYWGKPGAAWMSDANKTFSNSSYNMVYHLGEASTQTRTNSVGNYNHAAPQNYEGDERVQGIIGMADSLDGSAKGGDHLALGEAFTDLSVFTFTAWAKPSGFGMWERFLDLGNGEATENLTFSRVNASDSLVVFCFGTPTPYDPWRKTGGQVDLGGAFAGKAIDQGIWAMYGFTVNGKVVTLYKNGVKLAAGDLKEPLNKVVRTRNFIGHSNWLTDSDFKGVLDELQLTIGAHSPEWMRLTYESQRTDPKMFSWEFPPEIQLAITAHPVGITVSEGKPAKLAVAAVSSGAIAYQWYLDGAPLPGAQASGYDIVSVTLEHSGTYTCRVTDGKDTVMSKPASIIVPEEMPTWSHSQKIFINTTATGANLSSEVANIPVLVRLGRKNLDFSQVGAGGKDLRFTASDGTYLAHSIERWAVDTAEVWVRVNKVQANANGYFMMYWGKTNAPQASSPGNVFSLNDSWRVYYDFSDAATGSGENYANDATLNGWRGLGIGGVVSVADGAIGKCFGFSGSNHLETPWQALDGLKAFTVMAWVREKVSKAGPTILEEPHYFGTRLSAAGKGEFGAYSHDGMLGYWTGMKGAPPFGYSTTEVRTGDKGWHLVAITYTGNSMTLYADGTGKHSSSGENIDLGANTLGIGGHRTSNGIWGGMFTGDIDAVQVTGDAKGKDWIKLAYETQRPGSEILTFGAPADQAPPAPAIYPPAGAFAEPIKVQITCAADSARILYTLDGSEPDTVARGSTRNIGSSITLSASATVKAKAYWKGISSPVTSAAFQIILPVPAGDTLRPGATKEIDGTHRVSFPNQDSRSPVRLTAGPAWNPLPKGFDRVGPLITLIAVDSAAAFPGLIVEGDSLAGLSLFRRDPNLAILWIPPMDGQMLIPAAGTYFWGRDTLPPRIRLSGSSSRGDSLMAWIIIDDNVAAVQGKVRYRNGNLDSLGWWTVPAGEILEFTLPLPSKPETPLEARFFATDQSRGAIFPPGRDLTLPRPLPALAAPLDLKPGIQWKMAGLPLIADGAVSLTDLARMSGTGPLYAAIWRSVPGPDSGYLILKGDDTLPVGMGFWLAAEQAAPSLNFPSSRALASDTDGLFAIHLQKGWNLVTCPSFRPLAWPVSTKDGDAYLRSALKPLHGLADNGYSRPDSLRPWEAYYVWYDKDTTVRVGPGAPRVTDKLPAPKAARRIGSMRLGISGPGVLLDLGASAFARPGIGREDESRPPPVDPRASAWLAREGRALSVDYVAWDPSSAMAWIVAVHGQAPGASLEIPLAEMPEGIEAWAVSPSRRLKWRLVDGGSIPVTGDDTLAVYAGTPAALAKIGDLQRGRSAAGAFSARFRSAGAGPELLLDLPSAARVEVDVWSARGEALGGIHRSFSPGRHSLAWPALSGGRGILPQGAYFIEIRARGPDWALRRVESLGLIR